MGLFDFLGSVASGIGGMLGKIPIIGAIPNAVGKLANKAFQGVGHIFGEKGTQASNAIKTGLATAQSAYDTAGRVGQAVSQIPILGDKAREFYQNSGLQKAYNLGGEGLGRGREIYEGGERLRQQGAQMYNEVQRDPIRAGMQYGQRFLQRSGYGCIRCRPCRPLFYHHRLINLTPFIVSSI
jgi:hypothetical protein